MSATSIPDHARMAVTPDGRAAVVWEDGTAVRRRVLLRDTADGGRTPSPIHTLSTAIKAREADITVARDGGFVVAWHEEQFPIREDGGPVRARRRGAAEVNTESTTP